MLKAKAYAKINLYLAVVGKRRDGFHAIETILQSVDLADEITFERADDLQVKSTSRELDGEQNIVFRAAQALRARTGVQKGARIHVDKRIPIAAGLAGGSADAAATLLALNRLWDLNLPHATLVEIAASIGSDVPFCLVGGACFATGRGTELAVMGGLGKCEIVLSKPPGGLLASAVYAAFDHSPHKPKRPPAALRAVLDVQDTCEVCPLVENALDPVVEQMKPQVALIKRAAIEAGARCCLVSGSGPTVFSITDTEDSAKEIAEKLTPMCDFVAITHPVREGVVLE